MPPLSPDALDQVRHTVLLTTVHNLHDTPNYLATPVSTAARKTSDTLRIIILSPLFNPPARSHTPSASSLPPETSIPGPGPDAPPPASDSQDPTNSDPAPPQHARAHHPDPNFPAGISRTAHWDDVQRLLTFVYVQATKVAQDIGNILLDIDVLLQGTTTTTAAADPFPFPEHVVRDAERIFSGERIRCVPRRRKRSGRAWIY